MTLLAARYMTRFQCLAGECPDDCCHGWKVVVDQKHHDLMRAKVPEAELAAKVVPLEGDDPRRHALLVLNEDGRCTFQDAGRLCSVHSRFGHDVLPDSCAMYPRLIGRVVKGYEMVGTVSCPEVARLVLEDPAALDLVPVGRDQMNRGLVTHSVDEPAAAAFKRDRDQYMHLLALERFPLSSRLFFVAFLAAEVAPLEPDVVHGELELFSPSIAFAMGVVREILLNPVAPEPVRRLIGELDGVSLADDLEKTFADWRARPKPADLDLWMARYARHYVQREWFTRSSSRVGYVHGLLARVAVLRFLIASHPRPDLATAVRAINALTRMLEHDRPLAQALIASLEAQGMTTLEHAACLATF